MFNLLFQVGREIDGGFAGRAAQEVFCAVYKLADLDLLARGTEESLGSIGSSASDIHSTTRDSPECSRESKTDV